jgi:hypothetical protein
MEIYKQNYYYLANIVEYSHMENHDKGGENPGDFDCMAFAFRGERERVTPRNYHKNIMSLMRIRNTEAHRVSTDRSARNF